MSVFYLSFKQIDKSEIIHHKIVTIVTIKHQLRISLAAISDYFSRSKISITNISNSILILGL